MIIALLIATLVALLVSQARAGRAVGELRENEARFRLIADRAPVMMWTTRPDTTLDFLNATCSEFTGLPLDDLLGEGWLNAVHPDDREPCARIYMPAIEARVPFRMEYRVRRADGVYRWVLDLGVPKPEPDGRFSGYVGCTVDITDRKESEQAIRVNAAILEASHQQNQDLAGRVIRSQEIERARIARDLHDGLSQDLAGLSIAISSLKRRSAGTSDLGVLHHDIASLQERTFALAESIRNLSHRLHPSVLDHAGLVPALSAHCADLQRQRQLTVSFAAEGDFSSADRDLALCLYRVTQEALRNVVKHAEACRAEVRLFGNDDRVELTITDDGKGFNVAATRQNQQGLGLVSMTERARLAGGTVSIVAEPNRGTTIRLELSRQPQSAAAAAYASLA